MSWGSRRLPWPTWYNRSVTTDPLLAALAAAQEQHQLFAQRPAAVVVGVSGGADSVCLLHALAALAAPWSLTLHVAHVNHALRPSADRDAAFVSCLAQRLGLPFHSLTLAPGELDRQPGGREAAGRAARQRFLHATAINVTPPGQVPHVALAHHADDQAETMLLRLVQGAGLAGLGGMRPVTSFQQPGAPADAPPVRVVRPLLYAPRAMLRAYLARQQAAWCEDPTNADAAIPRNRLRHVVLPELALLNPAVSAVLARTAELLAGEGERLARLDAALLAQLSLAPADAARVLLDLAGLRDLAAAEQRGVLRQALLHLAAPRTDTSRAVDFAAVDGLVAALAAVTGATGPHPIAAGLAWSVAGGPRLQLSLHRAAELPFPPRHPYLDAAWREQTGRQPVSLGAPIAAGMWQLTCVRLPAAELPPGWERNPDPWRACLDADAAGAPCLTTPAPGMRCAPLGMAGRTRALGDLFTDHKTPVSLRPGWPVVVDSRSGTVLWVCGLQPMHAARITPATATALCLQWEARCAPM